MRTLSVELIHLAVAGSIFLVLLITLAVNAHVCVHDKIKMEHHEVPRIQATYLRTGNGTYLHDERSKEEGHHKKVHRREFVEQAAFDTMRVVVRMLSGDTGYCKNSGDTVVTYTGATVTCDSADVLTASKRDYVENVLMLEAVKWFTSALNVQRVTGNLVMSRDKCGSRPGVDIPSADQSTGVSNADFVAYVTAVPMEDPNAATVAWAFGCIFDQNGRPVAGHVNFIPRQLTNADTLNKIKQADDIITAVHEVSHALGFSAPFFQGGYVDLDGNAQTKDTATIVVTHPAYAKEVTKITTPRVLREARKYYGCSTLDGLDIEDQGGSGTAGSHWEKRVLYPEYMVGISSSVESFYSPMSLALFEDTGHYTANYAAASSDLIWGKGKGCDFLNKKCNDQAQTVDEFCFKGGKEQCTHDRLARGHCALAAYSTDVPTTMQYFSDPKQGGSIYHADFCPTAVPYSDTICIDPTNGDSQDIFGNTYSSGARCFDSDIIETGFSSSSSTTRCFTYSCSSIGAILINVKGQSVKCPTDRSAGGADTSSLSGFNGYINCPHADVFCVDPKAPTPVPTPAPPTPEPTPAPPGSTPEPPAVTRPDPTGAPPLPVACNDRAACAANLASLMPSCRLLTKKLIDCFGTNCDSHLVSWLDSHGFSAKCKDRNAFAADCQESYAGVADLCGLSGTGRNGVYVMMLVLAMASIWMLVL